MEIKRTKRLVEIEDEVFIAEDGTEFASLKDCQKYEDELQTKKTLSEAEKLEIKELEDTAPLDTDAQYIEECHCFAWYKVNNAEELGIIAEAYTNDSLRDLKSFPETICIEYDDNYRSDSYMFLLSDMRESTINFWKKHGFAVEFKEIEY